MIYDVSEAIRDLNREIDEAQNKIAIVKSIDFTKPVTENQWHTICETPLRSSDLLAVLVKNTFPLAENILVHCNYVYFDMLGFKVQIPTSGKTCKKWWLFIVWWFRYRWKDPKRKQFEEVKSQQEQAHKERVERCLSKRKDIKNKTETLLNKLLPLLNEFSTQHYDYNSRGGCYSIEQIRELEKL